MDELEPATPKLTRGSIVQYAVGLAVGVVVLWILLSKRGELSGATTRLAHVSWPWVVATLGCEAVSLAVFALAQHRALSLSGASVGRGPLLAITTADNALALTVPGEPAVSSVYRYRQYRRRGASSASITWTLITIILAQAVAMCLILFAGVLVALLGDPTVVNRAVVIVGLVVVALALIVLSRRELVVRVVEGAIRLCRRVTGRPRRDLAQRIERVFDDVREIPLSLGQGAGLVSLTGAAWLADAGCLTCAFASVHAAIPWPALLLAYGVAQIVTTLPIAPGGLGLTEGSLAGVLIAYGVHRVPAISAVLLYRIVSYWLAIVLGWSLVGGLAYLNSRRPPHFPPSRGATGAGDANAYAPSDGP